MPSVNLKDLNVTNWTCDMQTIEEWQARRQLKRKAEKWQTDIMLRLIMILLMTQVLEDGRC